MTSLTELNIHYKHPLKERSVNLKKIKYPTWGRNLEQPMTTAKISRHCILKDSINPLQLFVEKRQFFNQNNQWLNNITHISLNSKFIVVLDGIICFSEQSCDNSLLVLNGFSGLFFHKQKCTRVFRWQEDITVVVTSALSSTKPCLSFLKF